MEAYEVEINRIEWSKLHVMEGSANNVPDALKVLLNPESTAQEAKDAYWQIENHVVVQGGLFTSAEAVVTVLTAALTMLLTEKKNCPHVEEMKLNVLELIFQIVAGHPGEEAAKGIDVRCRNKAREGLSLFYSELLKEESEVVLWILSHIEPDKERLKFYVKQLSADYLYQRDLKQLGLV